MLGRGAYWPGTFLVPEQGWLTDVRTIFMLQEAETTRLSAGKIAAIVAVGVVVALLLLLLLFSGDSAVEMESTQPLTVT